MKKTLAPVNGKASRPLDTSEDLDPVKKALTPGNGQPDGFRARNSYFANRDPLQTLGSLIRRGASAVLAKGVPGFTPQAIETVLSFARGRASHRAMLGFRYFSFKRFLNFWLIELQLYVGATRVRGYPYEWETDTTNICQLKCPLCHTGLDNIRRLKGVMHFDTFRKTIDEIKDYVIWLSLYSWGEPLINKQIPKFISYAHQAKIATLISSNLSLPLTPEKVEAIVRSGLDVLIISMDGITQEVYEKYRVKGKLSLVLENIRLFVQKKKELGYKTPYLEWQFIVMKQNEHQMPEARRLARELGVDKIVFKRVDFPHGMGNGELTRKWVPVNTAGFRRDDLLDKPYNEKSGKCWRLWRSAVVNWDGGYAPCCYLTDAKDDFGNVKEDSVKTIWNNAHYRTARTLFRNGNRPEVGVGCLTCEVYLESPNGRKHSAAILRGMRRAFKEVVKVD
ncbi:MAG: radical SAM/SPASM domain-containing protein [Dehalococcoidia bacterium]